MPKGKRIIIDNQTFNTQKELELYMRKNINEIGLCKSLKTLNEPFYHFVCELFKRHPRYEEKCNGMIDLEIILNTNGSYEFMILKKNNTGNIDISWPKCVTAKEKTNKDLLLSALRSSIEDQTSEFRNKSRTITCELCNNLFDEETHVDHIRDFSHLVNDFLSTCSIERPTSFEDMTDGTNRKTFKQENNDFRQQWEKFHRDNASLRLICKSCNLKRPKVKYNF